VKEERMKGGMEGVKEEGMKGGMEGVMEVKLGEMWCLQVSGEEAAMASWRRQGNQRGLAWIGGKREGGERRAGGRLCDGSG